MTNQVSTMSWLSQFFCTAINPGFCSNMTSGLVGGNDNSDDYDK